MLQWVTLFSKYNNLLHLQGNQRVASEDFSLEVSERKFTLTLREWEQKLEVPNPHGNDPEGPDLEKPFHSHGLAQRE